MGNAMAKIIYRYRNRVSFWMLAGAARRELAHRVVRG